MVLGKDGTFPGVFILTGDFFNGRPLSSPKEQIANGGIWGACQDPSKKQRARQPLSNFASQEKEGDATRCRQSFIV